MSGEEHNFLDNTYHDSLIKGVERRDNKTTLIITNYIPFDPGKPFTLLTLVNADNITRMKWLFAGYKHKGVSVVKATAKESDEPGKNFRLEFEFHSGTELEVHCYNFWTERVEQYKDYTS